AQHHRLVTVALGFDILDVGAAAADAVGLPDIGRALGWRGFDMAEDRHGDNLVAALQPDAAHPRRLAALEHADVGDGEADRLAVGGGQQHVVLLAAHFDPHDAGASVAAR